MPTILIASLALVWLVSHPDYQLPKQGHVVLYGTHDRVSTEESKENGSVGSDVVMTEESDDSKNNLLTSSNSDWVNKNPLPGSIDNWSRTVVDGIDRLCCDGGVQDPEGSRTLVAATRSRARASAEAPDKAGTSIEAEEHDAPVLSQVLKRVTKAKAKACCEAKRCLKWSPFEGHHLLTLTSNGSDSKSQRKSPTGGVCWKLHPDFLTDSWSSRMIRDVGESSFHWNKESVLSSKSISLCST
jgi:hypothetical protein